MAKKEGLGLLYGDTAIAEFLFGDERKRRKVTKIKGEGWPIFTLDGKSAARPEALREEAARREKRAASAKGKAA